MVYWAKPIEIKTIAASNANMLFVSETVDHHLYYFHDILTQELITIYIETSIVMCHLNTFIIKN